MWRIVLRLRSAETGGIRTESLPSKNGKRFASRLTLVSKTSELPRVGLDARFGSDGLIRGMTPNVRISVADQTISLSEVSTIERDGAQFKLTLRDGKTVSGPEIKGLPDSVQIDQFAVPVILAKAASIAIRIQLSDVVRYTVRVKDGGELVAEETGRILGIAASSVRARLHRARTAMRKRLEFDDE